MRSVRWIIVVLLLAAAVGLGWKIRNDWRRTRAQNDPKVLRLRPLALPAAPPPVAARDYSVVAQQNPFHPERNPVIVVPEAPRVGPPPLVYGSIIIGKERFALLAPDGGNNKPVKVSEGQMFEGYKVAEVRPQSVVLDSGAGPSEIMFYNALSRLRRDTTKTTARTAPGAAASSTVAAAGTSPAGAAPAAGAPPPPPPPTAQAQQPTTPAPAGKRLVQTPFGPIWADKQ